MLSLWGKEFRYSFHTQFCDIYYIYAFFRHSSVRNFKLLQTCDNCSFFSPNLNTPPTQSHGERGLQGC